MTGLFTSQLVRMTGSQIAGMFAGLVTGFATWLLAAHRFPPSEVGIASRLVTAGTLASGLVAAGAGQYLLAVLPHLSVNPLRIVVRWTTIATVGTAVIAGAGSFLVVQGSLFPGSLLLMVVAVSVSVTTLQDAVYIARGRAADVAAKAIAIGLAKVAALAAIAPMIIGAGLASYAGLVLLLAVPQLCVAVLWLCIRLRAALSERGRVLEVPRRSGTLISMGYAYALAAIAINWGWPAVLTSTLSADRAALFYIAWTVTSLVGAASIALANSIVGSGISRSGANMRSVIALHGLMEAGFAAAILSVAPFILTLFGGYYVHADSFIPPLLVGQSFSGVTAVLIAFMRTGTGSRQALPAIAIWAACGFGIPAIFVGGAGERFLYVYPVTTAVGMVVAFGLLLVAHQPISQQRNPDD